MYDYGARFYMPDLGRWNGIDPLAEAYSPFTPYAYVANNPINYYDPDGMRIEETSTGWTFTGSDINLLHSYLTSGTSMGSNYSNLMSQLDSFDFSGGSGGGGGLSSFWSSFNGGNTFGGISVGNNGSLSWWTNMPQTGIAGDIQGLTNHRSNLRSDDGGGVGQPGEWESLIPIWGSGRAAVDHFQNGNYWRGAGYTALAISDVFMVKSIATGLGRGAWKLGSHSWSATRKWMMKKGYAGAGEPLHHWAITQATAKKYGVQSIANQPWNLLKFSSQSLHMRAGHGMNYLGQPGYNALGQFWYGTPTWFKAGAFSTVGHGVQFGSYQLGPEDY